MREYSKVHKDGVRGWLCQWFKGCDFKDIRRENVAQFMKWVFLLDPRSDDDTKAQRKWSESFVRNSIDRIEGLTNQPLKRGSNPNISFIRNTNDAEPLATTYRPFLFYVFLWIGQQITDLLFLYILRFEYRYINGLRVWYKVQNKENMESTPIMLVHGLGVHFMPYIPMIYKFSNIKKNSKRPLKSKNPNK